MRFWTVMRPLLPNRSSLAGRLIGPTVGLVAVAVLVNLGFASWLAARRAALGARERQLQVAAVLRYSRVAPSLPVLRALRERTGDEFVVWDGTRAGLATLPAATLDAASIRRGLVSGDLTLDGTRYRIGEVRLPEPRPSTLLVLAPNRPFSDTLAIVWPFLVMAGVTLAVLVPLGILTARRMVATLGAIERHVGRIAAGDFGHSLPTDGMASQPEEIRRLVDGVNRMGSMLEGLESSLVSGERQRLLGQLAAGFAHELRNAVTGASLAIDLHRRRCPMGPAADADESLAVAKRQLEILEEEVRGLLALGKPVDSKPDRVAVEPLLDEVRHLVTPRCDHAGVRMECGSPPGLAIDGRRESLRAAIVNLVLNGIDAAGDGGRVRLEARRTDRGVTFAVTDSGLGPPDSIRGSIREPFVTGKPEGIGLGLAVAVAVAGMHGGTLDWHRENDETVFELRLPGTTLERSGGSAASAADTDSTEVDPA